MVGISDWGLFPYPLGISNLFTGVGRYLPLSMELISVSLWVIR